MIKLNKKYFARNKERDHDVGDIFNRASSGINNVLPFIITLFFTPVLITSSFLSKELIVMLANILLSTGYVSNFAYHAYQKEVSKTELLISILAIAAFIALTYYLSPLITAYTFAHGLILLNQVAAAINLFFIVKHVIVPPIKKIFDTVAKHFGFNTSTNYYSKRPFTLNRDRVLIDRILQHTYQHDSSSPKYTEDKLARINVLLKKLCQYVNKYEENFFGYITKKQSIAELEGLVTKLTTQGDPDSCYTFIHRKIGFKTSKIHLLTDARKLIVSVQEDTTKDAKPTLTFFTHIDEKNLLNNRENTLKAALSCIDEEICRQQQKITTELEVCLPVMAP